MENVYLGAENGGNGIITRNMTFTEGKKTL